MERNLFNQKVVRRHVRNWALTAMVVAGTFLSANAGSITDNGDGIIITSLGMHGDSMMFSLHCENAVLDRLSIELVDNQGARLYREVMNSKVITRTFKSPADIGTMILTITHKTTGKKERFAIVPESHMAEDVSITNIQ